MGNKSKRRPLTPLTRLVEAGPLSDVQAEVFLTVIAERTELEKRLSLAKVARGGKNRVSIAWRKAR